MAAATNRIVFAAVVDGDVVGSAELKLHGASTAEIAYVVHPARWGQGRATLAHPRGQTLTPGQRMPARQDVRLKLGRGPPGRGRDVTRPARGASHRRRAATR